jgi:D-tyrosyl-tRNA(Tyr) deacylase
MRVVLQRSKAAQVTVEGETIGRIDHGLVLLVGVSHEDTEQDAKYVAEKVAGLRIFEDESGRILWRRPGRSMRNRFMTVLTRC